MDTTKANKILIPYMMHLLEKITSKKFSYNMGMAAEATKHSEYMASNMKISKTPENLLYCNENLGTISVPARYAKLGVFNIVNNWFKYEHSKGNILNSNEVGIGIATVLQGDKVTLFVTQRLR